MVPAAIPVFDGHNDTLLHLYLHERGHGRSFFERSGQGHVAFDVSMLRGDGGLDAETPLAEIVRHVEYIAERSGIERVGFGSDFDGATVPSAMADVTGLPALLAEFQARGYDDAALRKLAHENWLRVLRRTWRE